VEGWKCPDAVCLRFFCLGRDRLLHRGKRVRGTPATRTGGRGGLGRRNRRSGKHIDLYVPSVREALYNRGRRTVEVYVLAWGTGRVEDEFLDRLNTSGLRALRDVQGREAAAQGPSRPRPQSARPEEKTNQNTENEARGYFDGSVAEALLEPEKVHPVLFLGKALGKTLEKTV